MCSAPSRASHRAARAPRSSATPFPPPASPRPRGGRCSLHRPPAASRGSRCRLVQEREATQIDAARGEVRHGGGARAPRSIRRARRRLRAGGFDEEAIAAARRSFTFAPDPEPRWYAAMAGSYPADAVRVIALPLSQDDDGGIERVRRLAARARARGGGGVAAGRRALRPAARSRFTRRSTTRATRPAARGTRGGCARRPRPSSAPRSARRRRSRRRRAPVELVVDRVALHSQRRARAAPSAPPTSARRRRWAPARRGGGGVRRRPRAAHDTLVHVSQPPPPLAAAGGLKKRVLPRAPSPTSSTAGARGCAACAASCAGCATCARSLHHARRPLELAAVFGAQQRDGPGPTRAARAAVVMRFCSRFST